MAGIDKAAFAVLKHYGEPFSSTAIKAELQSNESGHWGLRSLCCMLCPLLMASRCGGFSQVWLWKTFPHINPIRSDPAHELAREQRAHDRPKRATDTVDLNNQISHSR